MENPFLNIFRGTLNPKILDEARAIHNAFLEEGRAPGMEIARSLGGLSHNMYAPAEGVGSVSDARPGELLLLDYWADSKGSPTFLSDKNLRGAAARLFSSQDHSQWMPARAAFTFQVPAMVGKPARFLKLMRAPVRSDEAAIAEVAKLVSKSLGAARRRGQLSHHLFVRLAAPTEPVETLGLDYWRTLEGLMEHHREVTAMSKLGDSFAGPPPASIWEQASGFCEWGQRNVAARTTVC